MYTYLGVAKCVRGVSHVRFLQVPPERGEVPLREGGGHGETLDVVDDPTRNIWR